MRSLIAEQSVLAPDGREWTVGIRWLPRRPTWLGWGPGRRKGNQADKTYKKDELLESKWYDGLDLPIPDEFPGFLIVIAVILVLVFAWFVVLPLAVFVLDLVLLLLIAAGGIATRVLFRRPWIVEASTAGDVDRWAVVGFRSSKAMVGEVSWALQNGRALEEL